MDQPLNSEDTYNSPPNEALLSLVDWQTVESVLDLGAGSGSNLCFIKKINPEIKAIGVTCSEEEAKLQRANGLVSKVLNLDGNEVDQNKQPVTNNRQDVMIISQVIEQLSDLGQAF